MSTQNLIWVDGVAYKLVPIEPSSKQICLMALEVQGVNEKGVCRTDDPRWPESVAKAEAAYKAMIKAAPQPTTEKL